MKRFLLPALSVMLPFLAMGQFKLNGTITDKNDGSPLPGAVVKIEQTYKACAADDAGTYEINGLKKGSYKVTATYLGYSGTSRDIEITGDTKLDLQLERNPIRQEEIVITATRAGDKSPTAFENISKIELRKLNLGQDLPYLLDATPSAVVSSDAGAGIGYTGIRIRGTDITRINVTVNGIPLNDQESQGVFWVNMPDFTSSVDNIQVQRGVGTSGNGSAAFGASINIETLKLNAEAYAETNNAYGSFDTYKNNLLIGSGLLGGHWAFDGRLSRISSSGFVDRGKSNLSSFFLSGGYYGKKHFFRFNILSGKEKTYQAWNGIPKDSLKTNRTYNAFTYDNQTDNYRQDHYQLFYGRQLGKRWNLNLAGFLVRGIGYYEEYQDINDPWGTTAYADYGFPDVIIGNDTLTNSSLVRRKWLDNYYYGLTFSSIYDDKKHIKITIGGAATQYDGKHYGTIEWMQVCGNIVKGQHWYDGSGVKTDANIFVKGDFNIGKHINVFADVQYRFVNHQIDGLDGKLRTLDQTHQFNFINPKAGINYVISDKHRVYASLAMTSREPNRSNFTDADPGKPAPVAEKLTDIEAGYGFTSTRFKAEINGFYMYYKDQLVLTGEINDVGSSIMTNVPKSYRSGAELSLSWSPAKWFGWNINAAYSINKIIDFVEYVDVYDADWNYSQQANHLGNTDLSFSPALVAGNHFKFTPVKNFEIGLISKYVSRQYIDNTASKSRSLDPFFVTNALLSYHVYTKLVKDIGISLLVNNVFNEQYETNAWVYRYIYDGKDQVSDGYFPQAGTNFLLSLGLKF
jgi:iron complex outermembrane receptor protein